MAVKLLQAWKGYLVNQIVRTDARAEERLIFDGIATATLTGGIDIRDSQPCTTVKVVAVTIEFLPYLGDNTMVQDETGKQYFWDGAAYSLPGSGGGGGLEVGTLIPNGIVQADEAGEELQCNPAQYIRKAVDYATNTAYGFAEFGTLTYAEAGDPVNDLLLPNSVGSVMEVGQSLLVALPGGDNIDCGIWVATAKNTGAETITFARRSDSLVGSKFYAGETIYVTGEAKTYYVDSMDNSAGDSDVVTLDEDSDTYVNWKPLVRVPSNSTSPVNSFAGTAFGDALAKNLKLEPHATIGSDPQWAYSQHMLFRTQIMSPAEGDSDLQLNLQMGTTFLVTRAWIACTNQTTLSTHDGTVTLCGAASGGSPLHDTPLDLQTTGTDRLREIPLDHQRTLSDGLFFRFEDVATSAQYFVVFELLQWQSAPIIELEA